MAAETEKVALQFDEDWLCDGVSARAVQQELCEGIYARQAMSLARQKRIAAANDRIKRSWVDGLGAMTMQIDMDTYMHWAVLKPGCWQDPEFLKEFKRDNEACRVRCEAPGILVSGHSGRTVKRYDF